MIRWLRRTGQPLIMNVRLYCAAAILCFGASVRGATLVAPVIADTALFEFFPTSNLGAAELAAGSISQLDPERQEPARTRSLIRFDVSGVPAGATVTSAEVRVTLTKRPFTAGTGSTIRLHRVLKAWGEGNKAGPTGGLAGDGEATWSAPAHPEPGWGDVGAGGESDAVTTASSSVDVDQIGTYTFQTSAALAADVQGWVANPASNFGWLMKSDSEGTPQSARRFGSKESLTGKPTLTISYEVAVAEVRITQFQLRPAGMFLAWTGGAAPYRVERAENILGPWTAVTAASNESQATAPLGGEFAFYRVVSGAP